MTTQRTYDYDTTTDPSGVKLFGSNSSNQNVNLDASVLAKQSDVLSLTSRVASVEVNKASTSAVNAALALKADKTELVDYSKKRDVASEYSETATYAVGDYFYKDGILYRVTKWDNDGDDFEYTSVKVTTELKGKASKAEIDEIDETLQSHEESLQELKLSKTNKEYAEATYLKDAPSDNNQYARKNGAWEKVQGGSGSASWDEITGKPSSFPPSSHTHEISDVNGLADAIEPEVFVVTSTTTNKQVKDAYSSGKRLFLKKFTQGGTYEYECTGVAAGYVLHFSLLANKDFYYAVIEVGGKEDDAAVEITYSSKSILNDANADGKQYARKDNAWVEVDTSTTWDDVSGKPETFAPSEHTHSVSDVSGLQSALDSKANSADVPTKTSDLTNDSGFTTKTYVDGLVGDVETLLADL